MHQTKYGNGLGLERISADFGSEGCGFGSDFHPRVRGFGYLQRCGFGVDYRFARECPLDLCKFEPNKPT
jgi:hypothetical protein